MASLICRQALSGSYVELAYGTRCSISAFFNTVIKIVKDPDRDDADTIGKFGNGGNEEWRPLESFGLCKSDFCIESGYLE
jgi:hypothetical protein